MAESSPLEKQVATLFAKTLRSRREELGLSQEDVAQKAGIDRNHYQLMEHARSDRKSNKPVNPQMFTLLRLADALKMPLEDLIEDVAITYRRESGSSLGNG
ncbi:MAG: helix-turn-helix domain-containing protein [Ancrocorticia sp.]|uniref:helix-turn-helix domain-containing protein n=1 Tax=Ancrocorticia sp. TaxID=2593684 RepID=UPI003F90CC61